MLSCDLVHPAASQPVEGPPEVGCQAGVATCVGQQARCCSPLQWPVVTLPYRAVASCCIGRVPASADDVSDTTSFIKRKTDESSQNETSESSESPSETGPHDKEVANAEQPNLGHEQQEKDREETNDRVRWAFNIIKQRIRGCTESLGLSSISIDLAQIVHGYRISASRHVRFTAPQGMYKRMHNYIASLSLLSTAVRHC